MKSKYVWHAVMLVIAAAIMILCLHYEPVSASQGMEPVMVTQSIIPVTVRTSSSSWIDDSSIYSGTGSQNQSSVDGLPTGSGEKGWLAKATRDLLIAIAGGLLSLLQSMGLTLDLMIFGRVRGVAAAAGITADRMITAPYTFELVNGNIYGAVAGVMYGMMRTMCLGMMTVYLFYKIAKAAYSGTGKQLAELKDGVTTLALSALLVFVTPNIVELMLYARDVLLYQQMDMIKAMGGTPSVTGNMWAAYYANPTIVNAAMCVGACFLTVYFGASYVGLAVGMTVLFSIFPLCAVVAQYDKKLLSNFYKELLGSAITPCFDCLLLIIPCLMGRYLTSLYAVEFLTCCMIIPARQVIKSALGLTSATANTMGMAAWGSVMGSLNMARAITRTAGMAAFGIGRYAGGKIAGAISDAHNAKTEGELAKAEEQERSAAMREADGTAVRDEINKLESKAAASESKAGMLRATGISGTPGEAAAYDNLAVRAGEEADAFKKLADEATGKAHALRSGITPGMSDNERSAALAGAESYDAQAGTLRARAQSSMRQADGYRAKAKNSRELAGEDARAAELRKEIENVKADAGNRRIAGIQRLAAVNGTSVDEEDAALNASNAAEIENLTRNGQSISSQIAQMDTSIADKNVAINAARDRYKADKKNAEAGRAALSSARADYRNFMEHGGGSEADRTALLDKVTAAESAMTSANDKMALSEKEVDRLESERSGLAAKRARLVESRDKNMSALTNARNNQAAYAASHSAGIGRDGNLNGAYGSEVQMSMAASTSPRSQGLGAPGHPQSEYESKVLEIKMRAINYKNFDRMSEMQGVRISHQEKAQFYRKRAVMQAAQGIGGAAFGTAGVVAGTAVGGATGIAMETFTIGHTGGMFGNIGATTGGILGAVAGTAAGAGLGTVAVKGTYGASQIYGNMLSRAAMPSVMQAASSMQLHTEQTATVTVDTKVVEQQGRVVTVGDIGSAPSVSVSRNVSPAEMADMNVTMPQQKLPSVTARQTDMQHAMKVQVAVMQAQGMVSSLSNVGRADVERINTASPGLDTRDIAVQLMLNSPAAQGLDSVAVRATVDKAFSTHPELIGMIENLRNS